MYPRPNQPNPGDVRPPFQYFNRRLRPETAGSSFPTNFVPIAPQVANDSSGTFTSVRPTLSAVAQPAEMFVSGQRRQRRHAGVPNTNQNYTQMHYGTYSNNHSRGMRPVETSIHQVQHYEEARRDVQLHDLREHIPQRMYGGAEIFHQPNRYVPELPCYCNGMNNCHHCQYLRNIEERNELTRQYLSVQNGFGRSGVPGYFHPMGNSSQYPNPMQPQIAEHNAVMNRQNLEIAGPSNVVSRNSAFSAVPPKSSKQQASVAPFPPQSLALQDALATDTERPAPKVPKFPKSGLPCWVYLEFPVEEKFEEIPDSPGRLVIDEDAATDSPAKADKTEVPQGNNPDIISISSDSELEAEPPAVKRFKKE